ncbi:hypothetical protein CgunFtcFv8_006159 [Champsocephalus gunnari]|uniref:Uncharacterized protein n=1 Tax=Champsocephalus gunnari TaxID=52237 RepID=A0AAN8BWQ7_CHAGU|nr:hypothetical protein CgunFtcFv8_006159 [Champsocephalus gunnari]
MENAGFRSESFDSLHHPSEDDDDEMVDIAGATLDFSATEDDPPLGSGNRDGFQSGSRDGVGRGRGLNLGLTIYSKHLWLQTQLLVLLDFIPPH